MSAQGGDARATIARPDEMTETHPGATMLAAGRDRYGSTELVNVREAPLPALPDGEVLLRVCAAGLDRGVWHLMAGLPYPLRLAGFGVGRPKTRTLGREVAGIVHTVGGKVTGLRPGDEVFGIANGSFARYATASPGKLVPKPSNRTFEQAAALPISGLTALQAVRDHGRARAGHNVLVIGASGGVGTYAVQLAKAAGAAVTGVCSTSKAELVRSIGADEVVDYTREEITDRGIRYDVVLDLAGNRPLRMLRQALARDGTLVIVGGEGGGHWLGSLDRQLRAVALSPFVGQRLGAFVNSENHRDLDTLRQLFEAGTLIPVIDSVRGLADVPTAIDALTGGRVRGKIVIAP